MWLSDTATGVTNGEWEYNNQTFTIKIHVYASNELLPESVEPCVNPIYNDQSGANQPELVEGMIPVVYNECKKTWEKADTNHWYDYDQQIWANAVTVTETNRGQYMSTPVGTEISMEDINTMWYGYQDMNICIPI